MHIPQTRYGFPLKAPEQERSFRSIFRPTLGVHTGDVPQDLAPGFTPEARNYVTDAGWLRPRSGLSRFGGYSFGRPVLGGTEIPDASGELAAVASSASTIAVHHPSVDSWSELSYIKGSILGSDDTLSGLSTDYWSTTPAFDDTIGEYVAVLSNGTNWMKWFEVGQSTATYSDFTWTHDLAETKSAKAVVEVNDRLALFNSISSAGTKFPTRFAWSARGNIREWNATNGAGAEELVGMRGEGQTAVKFQDIVYLFSDEEVWIARPTLDDYAFRFDRITDKLGCPYPRTAVATPLGVIFLARDLEVYVVNGNRVQPLGPAGPNEPSRIQPLLLDELTEGDRAWAAYSQTQRRYELYYTARDSAEGFPRRALYFHIDDHSWLPQRFNHELTIGFDFEDPGARTEWGDLSGLEWNELGAWDNFGRGENTRDVVTFGSGGTSYRLRQNQADDDGSTIDARWRSHGLNQRDHMRQAALSEVWLDYDANSASSGTLLVSDDLGASFDDGVALAFDPAKDNAFVPTWAVARSPLFELRTDGDGPKVARFQASLRDAGRFGG